MTDNDTKSWGNLNWSSPELVIRLGTLEVKLAKSAGDVSTSFAYQKDVYWQNPENWLTEWRTTTTVEPSTIDLVPITPDRDVITRPIRDLFIPPQSETTIYVGYPAWVQLKLSTGTLLADLATELMSDTWLGPNTRSGEVAYATPTHARLQYRNLPDDLHLIRTPVNIQNDSEERLQISRLSIPAPELTTYLSSERLWTQTVVIHCDAKLEEAYVDIRARPPDFLSTPSIASPPREVSTENTMRKAIGFLLG